MDKQNVDPPWSYWAEQPVRDFHQNKSFLLMPLRVATLAGLEQWSQPFGQSWLCHATSFITKVITFTYISTGYLINKW